MAKPMNLTAQKIYDKEFSTVAEGYKIEEVDTFLDDIIEDYQNNEEYMMELAMALLQYEKQIKELTALNEDLKKQNVQLAGELEEAKQTVQTEEAPAAKDNSGLSLEDLDLRIRILEEAVLKNNQE